MVILFFILLLLTVYPYGIYPMAVYAMSVLLGRAWKKADIRPSLSIVISVYNEQSVIAEKVNNTLALDYPQDLLEILVVSDGSNDRTNAVVRGFADRRVVLKAFLERAGKTACLNRVVPEARGEIVVFTDANSMFPPGVLLELAKSFSDETIGLVTGWTKYVAPGSQEGATGLYGKLEQMTKYHESLISSCVGADGAIFAIRKELYRPLLDQDINDFVIPLHVIAQRKRAVLDREVFCFEESSKDQRAEFRRQVRITNRTLRAIFRNLGFLNPFRFGTFSIFLVSHKLLRFLVPFFAGAAFVTSLFLAARSPIYIGLVIIQIVPVALGLAGILGMLKGRLANFCGSFLLTLWAQAGGWLRLVRGVSDTMWLPQRETGAR